MTRRSAGGRVVSSVRERRQSDSVGESRVDGSAMDDIDQFTQDSELELQLKTVDGALECDLDGVVAGIL